VLIANTDHQVRTAVLVEPFANDGSIGLVPIKRDQPGDPFILDAAAALELARFIVDNHEAMETT
jgi:hypothetical protein